MSAEHDTGIHASRALRHPVWGLALGVLILNDHVLKGADVLPAAITGKLSDVAGLIVAPVVLAALLRVRSRVGMWVSIGAVGLWFASVNLVPSAARACEAFTAAFGVPWKLWVDPSDLLALPALGLSAWLMMRDDEPVRRRLVERVLAVSGALACMATSYAAPRAPATSPGLILTPAGGSGPVYMIEPSTGRRVGAPAFGAGASSIETGGVIYGVYAKRVVGIDPRTDTEVLRVDYEGGSFRGRPLTDGARIFMLATTSSKERLVAIDLRTAKVAWERALPDTERHRGSSKKAMLAGGLIVLPNKDKLLAYDPGTGRPRWALQHDKDLTWPAWDGRAVFAVDEDGTILSVDVQHGHVLWRHDVGSADGFDDSSYRAGARLGAGNGVLAFIDGERLVGIDAATRVRRWRGPLVDDVVVGRDVAVARLEIDDDDYLAAFRMSDGKRLWKLDADDFMHVDPAIDEDNGLVLIRPSPRELSAYTMFEGRLQWRFLVSEGARAQEP